MKEPAELFKILADTNRLRMLQLLSSEELTVTELAQLLNMPQSRVSSQLKRIKTVFALCERQEGRKSFLSLPDDQAAEPALAAYSQTVRESRQGRLDQEALAQLVKQRESNDASLRSQGGLGNHELPGRTWEGFARALMTLIPSQRVLDVGVGEGEMTMLLAGFSSVVHAVDPDKSQLSRLQAKAKSSGISNLICHEGLVEDLPLADASVDLVVVSQLLHLIDDPQGAIRECVRVLDEGGRLIVLDLLSHNEDWVREKFGHKSRGFSMDQLRKFLTTTKLTDVDVFRVAKDKKPPRFVSILATGRKEAS
ncbi:MAG: SAM-dependent methyltransferase [Planctomycetota bacterium]|jgi:SAM-dependent methyltransferase